MIRSWSGLGLPVDGRTCATGLGRATAIMALLMRANARTTLETNCILREL